MIPFNNVMKVCFAPKSVEIIYLLFRSMLLQQSRHFSVSIIFFSQFWFLAVGAEFLESKRINFYFVTSVPKDGINVL